MHGTPFLLALLSLVLFTGGMSLVGLAFISALKDTLDRGELMKRND